MFTRAICFVFCGLTFGTAKAQQSVFEEVTQATGIGHPGRNRAVAFVDIDNDGWIDIFTTRSQEPNLFFRNRGNRVFEESASVMALDFSGFSGSAAWGDLNNDGRSELYLACLDFPNLLYVNRGDGLFEDMTESAGVGSDKKAEAVGFVDYDLDGLLDIFVFNRGTPNVFYHNLGNLVFEDVLQTAGVVGDVNAMGLAFADYDNDGDQDLYLVYDGRKRNNLYRNNGDGTFTDVAAAAGVNRGVEGMAAAFGDYDNDGWLDLYITNLAANFLFRNNRDGTFADVTDAAGVGDIGMAWGVTWFDYDNDGLLDIYVSNASSFNSPPDPNVLYHNDGDGTFSIANTDDPSNSLGSGLGAACADIDNDGYLDLFITNEGGGNQLFRNRGGDKHWLMLNLVGTASNRDAIGARLTLKTGGQSQTREISGGMGWFSQNSRMVHFGLGDSQLADELSIRWPSGHIDRYFNVAADQRLTLEEGDGTVTSVPAEPGPVQARDFAVTATYPNPFVLGRAQRGAGLATTVSYSLHGENARLTTISVYNILGQRIRTLFAGEQIPGDHLAQWDGRDDVGRTVSQGVYIVRMTSGGSASSRKLLLIK